MHYNSWIGFAIFVLNVLRVAQMPLSTKLLDPLPLNNRVVPAFLDSHVPPNIPVFEEYIPLWPN